MSVVKTANPAEVFRKFVAAINRHDVDTLLQFMTEDHLFLDSLGNRVQGAAKMQSGWRAYFTICPDYRITPEKILADAGTGAATILATGKASGTIDQVAWQTPAAWQAIIRDGKVAEWRVFADNKPVYEILARRPH